MDNSRKKLLWSVILVILYFLLVFYIGGFNVKDKTEVIINIITIVLSVIGIVYECILIFNKKIDLNKHKNGVLACSIYFLVVNIISGVIGFSVTKELNGNKKERRELPEIELKEYTNKYICLIAFIICLGILLFGSKIITKFWMLIVFYVVILSLMIGVFYKQLIHDFKIFKSYFKEYFVLILKTWGKALVLIMITTIIIQIITNTTQANNQIALQNSFNSNPVFIAILAMFYAPIAEELMFRGVFRKFIKNKKLFVIVSGVVFGLMHVIDDSKTLAEFSYVFVYSILGIYLAGIYAKTNNLCTNIFMHFMQNTLSVIGMILLMFM